MNKKQKEFNNKGFSLIELIVVIAIMAVLAFTLAPQFIKYVESAKQSTDIQNASAIRTAIDVGVADGEVTSNVTVTIKSNKIEITGADAALTAAGLSNSISCESTGWNSTSTPVTVASYDITTYKWTPAAAGVTNTNAPSKAITDAFK